VWPATRLAELLETRYPIVQAPMAGGFTTPELVAAVSGAGGLGSIGGAMLPPDELRQAIRATRALTDRPFSVNLFPPLVREEPGAEAVESVQRELDRYRVELGLERPQRLPPVPPPEAVEAQVAVVAEERVPVFSFTLGVPPLDAVREAGAVILGTATTVGEAVELEALGVDAVVLQGSEAGGHRGTFRASFEEGLVGGIALVPQAVDQMKIPVVLAGGIMDGRGIAAALALGAEGVPLGTAFLTCPEAGTPAPYRQALAEAGAGSTALTSLYSGRPARAIRTDLLGALESSGVEPLPFPFQGLAMADIRAAAAQQGYPELMFLLSGQGVGLGRRLAAGELVEALAAETEQALSRLTR
jgi:nitronate monooxygenase